MAGLFSKQNVYTLPNVLSIFGFILVIIGCFLLDSWLGFGLVAIGRLVDLLDGRLARSTHSESRLGALLDASLDKLALLATIIAILYFGMAPAWILAAIVLQNVANTIATAFAERAHPGQDLKPSRIGKYAMVVQNAALAAFITSYLILPPQQPSGLVQFDASPVRLEWMYNFFGLGIILSAVGVLLLGLWATSGYVRRIWK